MPLHFCLQTNKQCCCLLRLTNHSSAFWPVLGPKLNMFYPAQFLAPVDWYQKQTPETGQCIITIRRLKKLQAIQLN